MFFYSNGFSFWEFLHTLKKFVKNVHTWIYKLFNTTQDIGKNDIYKQRNLGCTYRHIRGCIRRGSLLRHDTVGGLLDNEPPLSHRH